jgi:hypothetical protein
VASEEGQATVEWIGLVLLVAVALGALLTLAPPVDGRSLGGAVAHAITCAARGGCAAAAPELSPPRAGVAPPRPAPPVAPPRAAPPPRAASPPRAAPLPQAPPESRALQGARTAAKRLWLVCLGYRRLRHDLEHPRLPTEGIPVRDALDIANDCVNPLSFLTDD